MPDYIVARGKSLNEVHETRVMRGADCSIDHMMLRLKLTFSRRRYHSKTSSAPLTTNNTVRIHDDKMQKRPETKSGAPLQKYNIEETDLQSSWNELKPDIHLRF